MAESILQEIIEQVVYKAENILQEDMSMSKGDAGKCQGLIGEDPMTLGNEELKEVSTDHEIVESDNEVDSESEESDGILTDEHNDFLSTEDEAEDFLQHVLRDTNEIDQDAEKESQGFEITAEGCEGIAGALSEPDKSLNLDSALENIINAQSITESEKLSELSNRHNFEVKIEIMKTPAVEEPDSAFGNTSDVIVNRADKGPEINILGNTDVSVLPVESDKSENKKQAEADINNNNADNGNFNTLFDDTNMFKYDWSKCFNQCITDNRDLSTPDADMETISPELSCIMQLSPNETYGKDHTVGSQRLYSRQHSEAVRSGSNLNTPDPIFYDDTDSNQSDISMFRKYNTNIGQNSTQSWSERDVNNNLGTNDSAKGTKRKLCDIDNQVGPSTSILPDSIVTGLMNQGRPPDISTWRAVNSSCDQQGNFMNDYISGPWSKPTCAVPPFQNNESFSNSSIYGISDLRPDQQQTTYQSTAYNPYAATVNLSMPYQMHSQFNSTNALLRPSCQFTSNQVRNTQNYGSQLLYNGLQNPAAYRLDFSSPVNASTPGVLNFVSHPPIHGVDLTRPRAVHASNLPNTGYGPSMRYSSMPNRHILNPENFYQPHSQAFQHVPLRNPYMNHLSQTYVPPRLPSATQTFVESQVDSLIAGSLDNTVKEGEKIEELGQAKTTETNHGNDNKKVDMNDEVEDDNSSITGCEECEYILDSSDEHENTEKENCRDTFGKGLDNLKNKTSVGDKLYDDKFETEDNSPNSQDKTLEKAIESNEADSTTLDLTCDTGVGKKNVLNDENTERIGSPTPAHAYPKVQNKYFTEIYLKKSRSSSPISSFCAALDLSKRREEKREMKNLLRPTVPQKIIPYGEPSIPISAVLNSVQAPTLAYNGAMLVPYMNSIFAAMANLNKSQTAATSNSTADNAANAANSTINKSTEQRVTNTSNESPLTGTNNLTLNQQVLMYQNLLQRNQSSVSSSSVTETSDSVQNTVNSQTAGAPTMNINSIPLPLYAAPLQYPIRPLVPVVNPMSNTQELVNPYMYRFNLGVPIPMNAGTNIPYCTASAVNNNNTIGTGVSTNSMLTNLLSSASSDTAAGSHTTQTNMKHKADALLKRCSQRKSPLSRKSSSTNSRKTARKNETYNRTSAPGTRHVAAIHGINMSIQGSNISQITHTQSRGVVTYQPVPEARIYQPVSDKGKKVFKAKRYPFTTLQIGTYMFSSGLSSIHKVARVKFLFSKKTMVYEFQLESPDGSEGICKDMVEIIVPFCSIISLWLYEKDMRVEVKEAPKIYLGKKGPEKNFGNKITNAAVYNRKLRMDVTDGQIYTSPYHYIQLRNSCADRLKSELRDFDCRFDVMLRLPMIEDLSKSLKPDNNQPSSHLLDPSIFLPTEDINNNSTGPVYQQEENQDVSVIVSCSCNNGCSAESCQCCVKGTTCTEGMCECVNCRNPLNILHQLGLPAEKARTDPCLMENIYQIKRLDCYVKTQLVLQCCHIPVLLFNCIPGEVRCTNRNCNARYKYSWCTARLQNEDSSPRNHCIKCGKCTDFRNEHCKKCSICFFAGESRTLKCPLCSNENNNAADKNSSTESEA